MNYSKIVLFLGLCSLALMSIGNTALAADGYYNASYEPQFEITPDDICWDYLDTATGSLSFNNDNLVIDSTTESYTYYDWFTQDSTVLNAVSSGAPWVIEFKAKLISDNSYHSARTSMSVGFAPLANYRNNLWIADGEIFLLDDHVTKGESVSVNTTSLHTYTIVVDSDKNIDVYQDDPEMQSDPILEGSLYNLNGSNLKIGFGDATNSANGKSEWSYFRHNAYNGTCGIFLP